MVLSIRNPDGLFSAGGRLYLAVESLFPIGARPQAECLENLSRELDDKTIEIPRSPAAPSWIVSERRHTCGLQSLLLPPRLSHQRLRTHSTEDRVEVSQCTDGLGEHAGIAAASR